MTTQPSVQDAFRPVLAALAAMQSNASRQEKSEAHEFLEKFQKSSEAWNVTHALLQSPDASVEAKLFAATTLKGKITYDLDQLPVDAQQPLRDSLLSLLQTYANGPKPIRTQLCVCLASLAIQMTSWKDVLATVGSTLGNDAWDCILEFLRILPEEVTEGRKINLTEEELSERTQELLGNNSTQVLQLLIQYSQSSDSAAANPHLFDCISSWLREIPVSDVVKSPLLDRIITAINNEASFDAAVDCLCTIYRDTRDVDESMDTIQILYPKITALKPKILEAAETEDADLMKGISRIFAEAGEAWVVLIARMPDQFRSLVEGVLECCMRDNDRDAISLTFLFWYELKQLITLEKYVRARAELADIYSKLVDVMIKHLEFPEGNEADLFDGDREQEEKFREFRHSMGDVLKDCCEVIGVTECLSKAYKLIQDWVTAHASQATAEKVPHWQQLEAPIFSLRAMGRMVNPEESSVLSQVIPLIVSIPEHEKLKFQAIMALGRYTEWTAQHPETLEAQLNYVISGFSHKSIEVIQAAALAFKFLGTDCAKLLQGHSQQLHQFYESVLDKLKPSSQEEVTEGVAAVVAVQPVENIYAIMKMFCDPIMSRILALANKAHDDAGQKAVADYVQLITIFIQTVAPYVPSSQENPPVKYCQEILPAFGALATNFPNSTPILERVCRSWRYMVISYRTSMVPLLPTLAEHLALGFQASRQGCFLWATDAVIREFSDGAEAVDQSTSNAVYQFYEQQALVFLRILNELSPVDLPDVIEDFFRLATDAVRFFPSKCVSSQLAGPILEAALSALTLQQVDPLTAALHYLRDLLGFGLNEPSVSSFTDEAPFSTPPEVQAAVKQLVGSLGSILIQRVLTGMMFSFPEDCFADSSAVALQVFSLMPSGATSWLEQTMSLLPAGTLKQGESERLINGIRDKISRGEMRKVRMLLQDFTNSYRRRNVAPRDGLGRLEASRFRFQG
ncbi:putative mrna transport regulator [Phaeomoniella chlamydospora]|uniref:Putative mrna transport regulator n=1 Tax=Phaeomoniella chlamydospora TaxID=158046 RepID=A0A0G2FRA4_PHACM|nr:putative mrna transport regulator [Phaeomoniella chlamydospora]